MKRNAGTVALSAALLAALAGCAYQDPLELPELGPGAGSMNPASPYGPYYGNGYGYGYGPGYRYDPYYNYYYGGYDPRYYSPGVIYVPVPCADANHDGRCDKRPHGDGHQNDGDGGHHHGGGQQGGSNAGGQSDNDNDGDGGRHDAQPRWPGYGAPVAPAPVPRATPPAPKPPQARPPDVPRRAAPPPPPVDRGPRNGPGRSPSTTDDGPPARRPD